jgi:hypothetical protein
MVRAFATVAESLKFKKLTKSQPPIVYRSLEIRMFIMYKNPEV